MEKLPDELLEKIFVFLDVKDLLRCSLVCSHWKNITYRDVLWKPICTRNCIIEESDISSFCSDRQEINKWKYYYQAYIERCNNWRKDRYENYCKSGDSWFFQGWASYRSCCLLPTYMDDTIEVFHITRHTFKMDQRIHVPVPGLEPTFLSTDVETIVAVKSNIVLIYKKKFTNYFLTKLFANISTGFIKFSDDINGEDQVKHFVLTYYKRCGVLRIVHFKNNIIWLCDYNSGRLVLVSDTYEKILNSSTSCNVFKTGPDYVCFWAGNKFTLCTIEGVEKLVLIDRDIAFASFSENYLGVRLSGEPTIEIWRINDRRLVKTLVAVVDSLLVHDNFVYILDIDASTLICWNVEPTDVGDPVLLWRTTLSIPNTSSIFPCNLCMILDKYLVIFPSHKYKKKHNILTVLDPFTGEIFYTSKYSGILLEVNDRFIVTLSNSIDTGNNIYIRSYI